MHIYQNIDTQVPLVSDSSRLLIFLNIFMGNT